MSIPTLHSPFSLCDLSVSILLLHHGHVPYVTLSPKNCRNIRKGHLHPCGCSHSGQSSGSALPMVMHYCCTGQMHWIRNSKGLWGRWHSLATAPNQRSLRQLEASLFFGLPLATGCSVQHLLSVLVCAVHWLLGMAHVHPSSLRKKSDQR